MRAIKISLAALYLSLGTIQAQKEQVDCNVNYNKALQLLQENASSKENVTKSISLLTPCIKKNNVHAQLLLGRIYLSTTDEKAYKKGFFLIKKAAEQGNIIAATDLGVLYKYGKGCRLNFNKARYWFEKASKAGNDRAAYSLGYLYLKGFGTITQDYTKALYWFEKSKHPMASYWLGVCYYYGYGVEKNPTKAKELLGTKNVESPIITIENKSNNSKPAIENITKLQLGETTGLNGSWKGQLLVFDWSGKHIEQKVPITLKLNYDKKEHNFNVVWNVAGNQYTYDFTRIENTLYYNNFSLKLPHTSFKKSIPKELIHFINEVDFTQKTIANTRYLVASVDSYIPSWKESGAPMQLVLEKESSFSNTDKTLSDDALQALTAQENEFIKLYPNPFEQDLIVSYALENKAHTTVKIASLTGTNEQVLKESSLQEAGEYHYYVNGASLEKGLYIVTILVNNQRKTRIIVKK